MNTMAVYIAPVILGITTAMQKTVIKTVAPIVSGNIFSSISTTNLPPGVQLPIDLSKIQVSISPESLPSSSIFLFVVTLYVIELLYIMVYFSVSIKEGNNPIAAKVEFAKRLPLMILVFLATTVAAAFIGRNI
jgi:hypothetical protein